MEEILHEKNSFDLLSYCGYSQVLVLIMSYSRVSLQFFLSQPLSCICLSKYLLPVWRLIAIISPFNSIFCHAGALLAVLVHSSSSCSFLSWFWVSSQSISFHSSLQYIFLETLVPNMTKVFRLSIWLKYFAFHSLIFPQHMSLVYHHNVHILPIICLRKSGECFTKS